MKLIALLFLSCAVLAGAMPSSGTVYQLQGLKPVGVSSRLSANGLNRHHVKFENAQGVHALVYEGGEAAPLGLLRAMSGWASSCALEVECAERAFCTGDCRSMFYEMAFDAQDPALATRKCKLRSVQCGPSQSANATPAPAAEATLAAPVTLGAP